MNTSSPSTYNPTRLLWAGFFAILAAGAGFAIRGGIFGAWAAEYGFTATQLGAIGGAGFSGFCFGIIIGGLLVDRLGYGKLVALAFIGHLVSAVVTFGATDASNAYSYLYWGMFIFAYANGTLEAVANPLIATLIPEKRAHYLNILHASWPLGMVVGALATYVLGSLLHIGWKGQLAFFLVPTLGYALLFWNQNFPKSEAAEKGADFGEMTRDVGILGGTVICYLLTLFFRNAIGLDSATSITVGGLLLVAVAMISRHNKKLALENIAVVAVCTLIALQAQITFGLSNTAGLAITVALVLGLGITMNWALGSFLLFVLFITHALVGAVELGTDGWIESITGNLFTADQGKVLLIWTSAIMFGLRFCVDFIEKRLGLSPIGLLFVSATTAFIGLRLASGMESFAVALIALGIYAFGKTFFWPTMLAVVGDRFPRSGAVAMSIMGGIGMLSAGLVGGPGLGYAKDRYTAEALSKDAPAVYESAKASTVSNYLFLKPITAVDGAKLEAAKKAGEKGTPDQKAIVKANQQGDRATLKADSYIPLSMAIIYLLLLFYFKQIGGYRALKIEEQR
jgi:MFS family permease